MKTQLLLRLIFAMFVTFGFSNCAPPTRVIYVRDGSANVVTRPRPPSAFDVYMMQGGGYNRGYGGYGQRSYFVPVPPGSHVMPNGYFDPCYGTGMYRRY